MGLITKKNGTSVLVTKTLSGRTLSGGDTALNQVYEFFEQTIDTTLGNGNPTYTFPCANAATGYSPSVDVSWGDGQTQTVTGYTTHTYSSGGTYNVRAIGTWRLSHQTSGDGQKVTDILRWGELAGSDCVFFSTRACYNHGNLATNISATDKVPQSNIHDCAQAFSAISGNPNLNWFMSWTFPTSPINFSQCFQNSNVTVTGAATWVGNIFRIAQNSTNFNPDTSNWDISPTTSQRDAWVGADEFTGVGVENWDISNITDFYLCFNGGDNFNGDIGSWNTASATTLQGIVGNCGNFNCGDTPATGPANPGTAMANFVIGPNVTSVTQMFFNCSKFNQDLTRVAGGAWDFPSGVTNMTSMFAGATNFNGDISNWNTGNVTNMSSMFQLANNMESDLSAWDVSNVTNMSGMFRNRRNGTDIGLASWTTSSLTDLSNFNRDAGASSTFNPDVSGWDVSNVTNMFGMFFLNGGFNRDCSGWNTASLTNASGTFRGTAINFSFASWDLSNVTNISLLYTGTSMTAANVSASLIGWDVPATATGVNAATCFGGISMSQTTYAAAKAAYDNLIDSVANGGKGWDMTGAITWTA